MSDDEDPFNIDGVEGSDDDVPSPISLKAPLGLDEDEQDDLEEDFDDETGEEDDDDDGGGGDEGIIDEEEEEDVDGHEAVPKVKRSKKKLQRMKKSEFIDDEAELSGDDDVSEDELDSSDDDDKVDTNLVDLDAKELGSDEEEEIRRLYHKQLETEDRRTLLLLQEQLEENDITAGQRRRKKFRWQTKDSGDNSLRRHCDPDDEDSQEDDDDDFDYTELNQPRLKRPTAESILIGSTRIMSASNKRFGLDSEQSDHDAPRSYSRGDRLAGEPVAGPSTAMSDDSNSNPIARITHPAMIRTGTTTNTTSDINRFLFRDKELVEALSTKEIVITTREEKERVIQREIRRVLQSKSIFDQLYS